MGYTDEDAVVDSGGTARPITDFIVVDSGGTARPVKEVRRIHRFEDPNNPGSYLQESHLIWQPPPDSSVPNVAISKGPELSGTTTYEVTWDAASGEPETTYDVRVEWFVNGSSDAVEVIDESTGLSDRDYLVSDDVYAEVQYVNDFGGGPVTTTSTI